MDKKDLNRLRPDLTQNLDFGLTRKLSTNRLSQRGVVLHQYNPPLRQSIFDALAQPKTQILSQLGSRHMLDSAKVIGQHITRKTQLDLEQDRLLLGGVVRELLVIGEAANAVSQQTKIKIPCIPWKSVIGMRNQLIHGYFDVSYRIIWSTITEDIPQLITELEKIILEF